MALFVVAGVAISGQSSGEIVAAGGSARLISPWDLAVGELRPIAYDWTLPGTYAKVSTKRGA